MIRLTVRQPRPALLLAACALALSTACAESPRPKSESSPPAFTELRSDALDFELLGGKFERVSADFDLSTRVGVAIWVSRVSLGNAAQAEVFLNYFGQGVWLARPFGVRDIELAHARTYRNGTLAQAPIIDPVTGDTSYYNVLEPSTDGEDPFASILRTSTIGADVYTVVISRSFIGTPDEIAKSSEQWLRDSGMVYMKALARVRPDTGWRRILTAGAVSFPAR